MSDEVVNVSSEDTKPLWKSKTLAGVGVVWLGLLAKALGVEMSEDVLKIISDFLVLIGSVLAFIGRLKAEKKVKI